ncbi:MAG: helix-turn-helix domain-containing protein [Dyadobacter sp.]|uniref:GlxA family transcriptional regulator n=1 Tax=Dyadobacter sp. TaxID=1914288 RepID=UPI00326604C1
MVTISILTLRNAVLSSIVDAGYVFVKVNDFLAENGKPPLFKVQLVGLTKEVQQNGGLFTVRADVLLCDVERNDLIIIPSMMGNLLIATHLNQEFGVWVADQYKYGVEVASMCTGSFLLAFSGILKGKHCTTHWQFANEFKYYYPSVKLVDELMITDQNGIYSSAGSNAYWNLLIHLVERFTDRAMAIRTAKYFVVDLDKSSQSPFVIFNGLKDHKDLLILKVQEYVERNYAAKLTVDNIAEIFHVTRRTLERRFRKATRHTVSEYFQRVKVEAAKQQLEIGKKSILDIMTEVGYIDIQAFRQVFKRVAGMSPIDYRNKFNYSI